MARTGGVEAEHDPVTSAELGLELEGIQRKLADAIRDHDGSVEHDHAIAVLWRRSWNQVALLHQLGEATRACSKCGHTIRVDATGEAAKASREAVRQGELAVKLSKSNLPDRVAALERLVEQGKRKGRGIAEEARRRKRS
jgi:hypothetical protein